MSWATALALLTIGGSIIAMLHPLGSAGAPSRQRVLGAFATMNLGAAVLVAQIMPTGLVSTAMQLFFVLIAVWFFIGEIRASRVDPRSPD